MAGYWEMYRPPLESLVLTHDARDLVEKDQKEIISYLPNYEGKRILELGSGTGLFTARLAQSAGHVTALDFIQDYVDHNKKENGHLANVSFRCADVTEMEFLDGSFDMVFSNWFFMYLSDNEMKAVFTKVLKWLTPGGFFFLRESCYEAPGKTRKGTKPTIHRTTINYCDSIQDTKSTGESGFKFLRGKNLLTYVKHSSNPNQLCFLAKHVVGQESDELSQLMQGWYSMKKILMSERMYGHMWFSPGGESTNRDLCVRLGLRPKQRVLDVGCGTGANAFFMARHYGANVLGIDFSTYMINMAIERQRKLEPMVRERVQFEINDVLAADYDQAAYDLIYSRDTILHIEDKRSLFQKFYKWLKPGGLLFFTDFCKGPAKDTKDFLKYVGDSNYFLSTEASYCDELRKVRFTNIESEDRQEEFVRIFRRELESFVSGKEAFVSEFSKDNYEEYTHRWNNKIRMAEEGQLAWVAFMAKK